MKTAVEGVTNFSSIGDVNICLKCYSEISDEKIFCNSCLVEIAK